MLADLTIIGAWDLVISTLSLALHSHCMMCRVLCLIYLLAGLTIVGVDKVIYVSKTIGLLLSVLIDRRSFY